MSVDDILAEVKLLPRADQIRLLTAVNEQLANDQQEWVRHLQGATEMPIWSPFDSYEAAAELMRLGDADKRDV